MMIRSVQLWRVKIVWKESSQSPKFRIRFACLALLFQEMTGQGKKSLKTKRCTIQSTYVDVPDQQNECDEYANLANHDEWTEEDFTEALAQEGDDDAVYVMDFESAAKATKNWHQLIHHIR